MEEKEEKEKEEETRKTTKRRRRRRIRKIWRQDKSKREKTLVAAKGREGDVARERVGKKKTQ